MRSGTEASETLARTWAESGAMPLSGRPGEPPLPVPEELVSRMMGWAISVAEISTRIGRATVLDGPALLGERAAVVGLGRRGSTSCGGATKLFRCQDSFVAVSMAREDDRDLVPAWLELTDQPSDDDLWDVIEARCATRPARELVGRATLLGLPVSRLREVDSSAPIVVRHGSDGAPQLRDLDGVLVVDLSSLWAGPLCANVLGLAGARVIKVESMRRPDGARLGPQPFFDLLHGGHESVVFDPRHETEIAALRRLMARADVVIEASRPRALAEMGLGRPPNGGPRVWISITGYGREGRRADRVAFGDDAAAAGGLLVSDPSGDCFCADAVADPASGLLAAAATLDCLDRGGSWLLDVALSRTAAWLAKGPLTAPWSGLVSAPRARPVTAKAPALGQHTDTVVAEFRLA